MKTQTLNWSPIAESDRDKLQRVTAQRDELLAALKQAAKLLEPIIRQMNIRNHFSEINAFENTIQKTIAKVEANQ